MDRFLSDEIEQALNTLQRRDAKVLRLYFGLDGGREHTLEEIGGMLGVTRERVRQLRDRALKRLRDRSEEHTSELQSRLHLVCRLLLEKKKKRTHDGHA